MISAAATIRFQRYVLLVAVAGTALVLWTGATDTYGLPKATLLWTAALALVVSSAVRVAGEGALRLPVAPLSVSLGVFAIALVVATAVSDTPMLSVVGEFTRYTGLLSYTAFAVVAFHAVRVFDVDEVAQLHRVVTCALLIVCAVTIVELGGSYPFGTPVSGSATVGGTLGNANVLAGWIAIAVPAAGWLALSPTNSTTWRVVGAVAAVLGTVVGVETGSFQGAAATVPAVLFLIVVWLSTPAAPPVRDIFRSLSRSGRFAAGGLAAAAAIAVLVLAAGVLGSGLESGFVERGDFWRAAIAMFEDAPVLGQGLDTYGQHFLAERPASHARHLGFTQAESAHNVPLNLLSGGGVLLAATWLAIVVATGAALIHGLRRLDGGERLLLGALGASWIAYLLQASVSFDVPAQNTLHAVLAGSIVAIGHPPSIREIGLPGLTRTVALSKKRSRIETTGAALVVVVAVVVVGLFAAWYATRPLRADLHAGRAADALDDGDAVTAAVELERATDLAPWQGRYWVLRSKVAERMGEVFEATDHAEEAARREPGSSQYALLAARLNARYRDASSARRWFDEALERDPKHPAVYTEAAQFELDDGNLERARELAERATAIAPEQVTGWLVVGGVAEAGGRDDDARAAYERALELSPGLQEALDALARLEETTSVE